MPIHWQAAPISMIFGRHCEMSKVAQQFRNLLGFLTAKGWVWKTAMSCTRFRRHQVRCFMEQEVRHGEKAVYAGVQA